MAGTTNYIRMIKRIAAVFILSMAYAFIRYNIFGDVSLSQVPSYIVNKACSITSAICFFMAAYNFKKENVVKEKQWTGAGASVLTLHIILSMALLSEKYFPKLFINSLLNINGEMVLLNGALGVLILWNLNKNDYLKLLLMFCLTFHLFFLGYPTWLTFSQWSGNMPPISLVGFLFSLAGFIIYSYSLSKRLVLLNDQKSKPDQYL